ncbi:MAG: hypothetical protein IJS13_10455 [Paludibacteraceae bacterium]|nr:hypothetical protein [Paludibacteraceae bacterium]
MSKLFFKHSSVIRILIVSMVLFTAPRMFGVGWTPTDAGLVVNLEQGERFLLSVWVDKNSNGTEEDGEEFFVSNYNRYSGGYFSYSAGSFMKLLPATEITEMNEWSVGAPLNRGNKALGGIVYTIWNDGKTLKTSDSFKFLGDLTSDYNDAKACDVVFVVPTERGVPTVDGRAGLSSFDPLAPSGTLGRGTAPFNGRMGTGFLGMTYREVYMFEIPKANSPQSYTNAGLVTFNTTLSTWNLSSGAGEIAKGKAAYAYADSKHDKTPRTIFRLYLLDDPINSCSSYFFATDEQDDVRYRKNENDPQKPSDSTAVKRIYTMDRLMCMSRDGSTKYYRTDLMHVPAPDNTYYYVGYNDKYKDDDGESMGTSGAKSHFTNIRELPMKDLSGFKAPAGAYGQMVVDTTSAADNLGVSFEPVGYFLKIKETGKNIRLHKTGDNTWTCEEMWTISGYYASLHIRTMLMTGSEFREDDEGAPIEGWSKWVRGDSVPTSDGKSIVGKSGYAQITVNNTDSNGHMVFILGDNTKWIRYDNNGFMGLEMPLQYPLSGENKVTIMAPRIKPEYTFLGWTKNADGSGDTLKVGDEFTFTEAGEVKLYAQARYDGTLQMAISFMQGGKRYFLTHPGREAPRYARARHFDYWENTWQGMENAENEDPNYLSTYELRCPIAEIKRKDGDIPDLDIKEHVLGPRHYTMKGYTDSLTFYENFTPAKNEYIGLYYEEAFNTILANNTWAGLFTTTSKATELSWPNYKVPYITGVKIKSERYVEEYDPVNKPDSLILKVRANRDKSYVKYDPVRNQFNGQADSASATTFDVSAVIVADEHYIILPDTSEVWRDSLLFDFHRDEQQREAIWSKLIGKQLMAVMIVDGDTVYFHPSRDPRKNINDPNNLYLSPDFRVTQNFELIRDSRVSGSITPGDSARMEATDHYWHYDIVSGQSSPINVKDAGGNYIDVVDTFRITLSQGAISKIKEYRGRWNRNAAGLEINKDGSRYRDVIVHTKTYHSGDTLTRTVLKAAKERYSFGPLAGQTQQINFLLTRETYHQMLDKDGNPEGENILSVDTLTSGWKMKATGCGFAKGKDTYYKVASAVGSLVTLNVEKENTSGINYDTLVISTIFVNEVDSVLTVPVRVPLVQAALEGDELIWSAVYNKQRYYIMAGSDGLIARKYNLKDNTLYKEGTTTHLIKGMKNDANSDKQYITPWQYDYHPIAEKQTDTLMLKTKLPGGTTKYFCITGEGSSARGVLGATPSLLIYKYVNVYANDNTNFEEQVRIRYGADGWLKLTGVSGTVPTIELTTTESEGTVFSWGYLHDEYSLLNNGSYPSQESVEFGYNRVAPASVQTLYKARHEYSMLVDNTMTYLCQREQTRIDSLTSASREWKTQYRIDTIRDHRVATLSALNNTTVDSTLTTTITPVGTSPMNVTYGGEYVNIVDTLRVTLSLQDGAPAYRFKDGWSKFTKISDANLKIPLIRRTYHEEPYNGVECSVEGDEDIYTFPATIVASGTGKNDTHTFTFHTTNNTGAQVVNVYGEVAATRKTSSVDLTGAMNLKNHSLAQVSLADEKGNIPSWCVLSDTTANTVTVKCTESGIRSSRIAYLYLAYIVMIDAVPHFVNFRITISQQSLFEYANNQHLVHSAGASGDDLRPDGMQQVHENRRILYYYPEQDVELPVRERAFYGWWRWYREGKGDIGDSDVPDSLWRVFPRNIGKYNFPYRIIGDSVDDGAGGKKLVTMGRYTVFHYPSKDYGNKNDPPSKSARVAPPVTTLGAERKDTVTYAVDMSNYYDNLPMSLKNKNNVDIEMMDTMTAIIEPTLSIREVFELHPWTEMAAKLDGYKYTDATSNGSDSYMNAYMEEHEVMAPIGNRLLLRTEQRYNYENLTKHGHSESLLGYYMRDDNWSTSGWDAARQDSMIWCGGWDADCRWFSYNTMTKTYAACTHSISTEEDFLVVPARTSISEGHKFDTIYYFLRARSKRTTTVAGKDTTVDGGNWFNICRYKIIYHQKDLYGPKEETAPKGEVKALITNDEIEQNYEVLERLNFDYNKPGTGYTIYPHPLPWADASYGYTYPETSDLPHNRYHDQSDFPNHGEYGLINRIPYDQYWRKMEQHGGAANGYMIYCDGMASAGQVAALSLNTQLCEGQSMYFSGYVGNPSSQTGKSDPNFIFSVQGSTDGSTWEDITSYMTGDIKPSNNWYQIYFPINHNRKGGKTEYSHFRVQIFNVAANFDGNDFVIDDMCIFATKPPLLAYQANTQCVEDSRNDSITQVVLRLDYKGFTDKKYNNANVYYTIVQSKAGSADTTFVKMDDGYLHEATIAGTPDTIYGYIEVPEAGYMPIVGTDSIYPNMGTLVARFEANAAHKTGYIYETLDGVSRPVLYVIHQAKMAANKKYNVHMALSYSDMLRSICAMTSELKVTNRMMLELNGEEQQNREENVCPNSTYTLSMRVKGTQYVEGAAPLDLTGSCVNDWLLYGDTAEASSYVRYGHYYSDIVKVVKDILRANDPSNTNHFAQNLSDVNRNVMVRMQGAMTLKQSIAAYDLLADMVNKGYLTLYKSKIDATVMTGSELEYVVFPIIGSGSKEMEDAGIEVCPQPIHIKLTPSGSTSAPIVIGGINRDETQLSQPLVLLANEQNANKQITIHIDDIQADRAIHSVSLLSTDDPNFLEGSHTLNLLPNKVYGEGAYYTRGDDILLRPASASTYHMRPGYNYTFIITMQTSVGATTLGGGCPVGTIPFTVSVVPDYLRWDPKNNESNRWNNPGNWVGVSDANEKIHDNAHFAPLATSNVIIPTLDPGLPYPEVPNLADKASYDSIKQVGFEYNKCNVIRFMPGAAMGQQQRMNYNRAVVDLSTPHEKWALRAAPVTGMLSGDIFMANDDLSDVTSPWEVGYFDAEGRNKNTGNASFWLSVYNTATVDKGNGHDVKDSARTASAEWSKVTNGMTLSLPPASGWAVYTRTTSRKDAIIRLPKNDDIYYYYNQDGDRMDDIYEHNLQYMRDTCAGEVGGSGKAGKLAYPNGASQNYTLKNGMASTMFVFGNPTMGYIDIWGFMDDNPGLSREFDYITYTKSDDTGSYITVPESIAVATVDTITEKKRYLPPMHAIVLKATSGTSLTVTLDSSRVVTSARDDIVSPSSAPSRMSASGRRQGFMTVTAINPLTSASKSRLLIGQGYHNAVRDGEDAMLTTININEYNSSAPSTLFNIYASEGEYGLSVDLLDEIVNVPVSFYNMSGVPFEPVTELWFTGVNNIDDELVFYDALTGSEQTIVDGICIKIPTPEQNHEKRYYIRRRGFDPNDQGTSIATDIDPASHYEMDGATAVKIIKDGHVLILRDGHVYTMFGQKLR